MPRSAPTSTTCSTSCRDPPGPPRRRSRESSPHARISHFTNGGDAEYYLGSADWRPRNLRRRVEVVAPVSDPACRGRLDAILDAELADPTAWELQSDGSYRRRAPAAGADRRSSQERLLELAGATP